MAGKKIWILLVSFTLISFLQAGEKAPLKVFISADLEGIWGVVHADQTSEDFSDYSTARRWMAEDVNAVVTGLFEAGATEIVVNDSHGTMRNIIADQLHPRASLISGSPKPLSMMQGIDSSFDACILVGYHAKAGTAAAILDHTYSGSTIRSIKINQLELPELGINAAIAGYYQVPVIMVSGDSETCSQAKSLLGDEIVTVAVKEGIGRYTAKLLPAKEARQQLKEKAKEALLKRYRISPFKLNPPVTIEVEFLKSNQAEMPLLIPQVKRKNACTVVFSGDDFLEGFKLLRALIALASK